ncbi:hypothetical protein HaLaN_00280, partial [Haematococcus lacustris]
MPLTVVLPTPDCIDIAHLPPLDLSNGAGLVARHMYAMYPWRKALAYCMTGGNEAIWELRDGIAQLFICATKNEHFHLVMTPPGQRMPTASNGQEMYLYTHPPILEGPDGVPILRVTVLDNR